MALAQEAIQTAKMNVDPVQIQPGEYTVLLEPLAVYDLFTWLTYIGFSGLFYDEGRSCFSGRLGEEVASPLLTIYDEPIPELPGLGFDIEGVARQKMVLIENGVLKNLPYDSYSAHKVNKKSTGNCFMLMSPYGGFPFSISILPGTKDPDELTSAIKDGLLIKRFWYVRVVSPKEGIITGMTRDGTFIIKDGKVEKPAKNLRFQITLPDILRNITEIGKELRLYEYGRYPHLMVEKFRITGMTG
jgi:predicted Zn-dependent protease